MIKTQNKRMSTETLVLAAVMTALVIILQFMGAFVRLGPFQCSLVLMPIVVGAALCGKKISAWLGFVFGMVVLLNDSAAFYAINIPGTIITVLLKGILCGLCAGLVYNLLEKKNRYLAVFAAAIVCPVVNTGVFYAGCFAFFLDTIKEWAIDKGYGSNFIMYMIVVLAGGNFLVELASNIVLSPVVVRLLNIRKKANV
jgi:uncharacterized membrane protein